MAEANTNRARVVREESSSSTTRIPPYNIELEQALLGAILVNNEAFHKASGAITASAFYVPVHGRIYDACATLIQHGKPADVKTVKPSFAPDEMATDSLTVHQYLGSLVANATTTINSPHYADSIGALAARRGIIVIAEDAAAAAYDSTTEASPEAIVGDLRARLHEIEATASRSIDVIDASDLLAKPAPRRRWHVENGWMPADDVTLLGADGGEGKTTLAMQLAWCTVWGFPWLRNEVRAGGAVYFTAEEPVDELHLRLAKIRESIELGGDVPNHLKLISRADADAVLAYPDRVGSVRTTPLFHELVSVVTEIEAKLLVLDAAADVFGGDEINRCQVRSFIRLLRGVAINHECAVLLLAHPSVDGMRTGRGYSGSTHWSNAVRSRLYLTTPSSSGTEPDQHLRVLDRAKSNRSRRGVKIGMRWCEGHFAIETLSDVADAMSLERAKTTFLKLLASYTTEGRNVSHQATSPNFAPKLFAGDERAKGLTKAVLMKSMNLLFAEKRIRAEDYGRPSRPNSRLVEVLPESAAKD